MVYFDFVGLLRMLKHKGYELLFQLTAWNHDTCRAFNVKEIV